MAPKALIEYANDVLTLSNEPMTFKELFDKAIELSSLDLTQSELRSKMASLYTQLSIDGRFALLKDGKWDLKSRHFFEQVHISLDDACGDDDDITEDDEEEKTLLKEELGEDDEEEKDDSVDDDIDFDKPKKDSDEDY